MKAISLWQPWASMIRDGRKTLETRRWQTRHRGPLLICSAKKPKIDGHLCGFALCVVNLATCRPMTKADEDAAVVPYESGRFVWVLLDLERIDPFRVCGKQGIFDVQFEGRAARELRTTGMLFGGHDAESSR